MDRIAQQIAAEINARVSQVKAAFELLDGGATVPFIARYRKEATDGLDDTQLRTLEARRSALVELEKRRESILTSISEQGKLTPELEQALRAADTRASLEDLYLPYRPKRRTRAALARAAGLEPLAWALAGDPTQDPEALAAAYLRPASTDEEGVAIPAIEDASAALDGARQIWMERIAEHAALLGRLREAVAREALLTAEVVEGAEEKGAKFRDYFKWSEPLSRVVPHRALALFRGRSEEVLRIKLDVTGIDAWAREAISATFGFRDERRAADRWLQDTVRLAWRGKIAVHLELDALNALWERAEAEAITVFARNLKALLLAAPAGHKTVLGLDPGIRTGVKVALVDRTGRLVETATVYPFAPRNDREGALKVLQALVVKHDVALIAIGNGTASRETEGLARALIKEAPHCSAVQAVVVSEAGASVYSASELAALEFPTLDVSLRGAVSIARRLQDPLAELVKIEPRSIGVGQYQHDVDASKLERSLDAVVEDCVNAVGVDINTASAPLLSRVAGLGPSLARAIVAHRDAHGPFADRQALLEVPRLGPKTFEQCAGFLRVPGGRQPLDASAVHPEAYPVVERILQAAGRPLSKLMGDAEALRRLDPRRFVDARFGEPTVRDILAELEKPGRDPRPAFKTAKFADGVEDIKDVQPGMILEGTVTNVTAFGAFVDIGVHQDGLVHVSQLASRFVRDPQEVVKVGDTVKVKVLEVDVPRKRIALTMRLEEAPRAGGRAPEGERRGPPPGGDRRGPPPGERRGPPPPREHRESPTDTIMAEALRKLRGR